MTPVTQALCVMGQRALWLLWVAGFAPPAIIVGTVGLMTWRDHVEPVELWFEPVSIGVPDFCEGTIPKIDYVRHVRRAFIGRFTAWFVPESDPFPIGRFRSNEFRYSPQLNETVHPQLPSFMGQAFDLSPDRYHIEASWMVRRPGHFDAHPFLESNVFTVIPKDDSRCIQPGIGSPPVK